MSERNANCKCCAERDFFRALTYCEAQALELVNCRGNSNIVNGKVPVEMAQ